MAEAHGGYYLLRGTGPAQQPGGANTGNFTYEFYVNGQLEDEGTTSLEYRQSGVFLFSWIPPASGDYGINIIADIDNAIPESDETNNRFDLFVQVADGRPDLCPAFISVLPRDEAYVQYDTIIKISTAIENRRPVACEALSNQLLITRNGEIMESTSFTQGGLPAGQTGDTFDYWYIPELPGDYMIKMIADEPMAVKESDELNNYLYYPIHVEINPWYYELQSTGIVSLQEDYPLGQELGFTTAISNIGGIATDCEFEYYWYLNNQLVTSETYPILLPGETGPDIEFFRTPPVPGDYTLSFQVDSTNQCSDEADEINNICEFSFTCTGEKRFPIWPLSTWSSPSLFTWPGILSPLLPGWLITDLQIPGISITAGSWRIVSQ